MQHGGQLEKDGFGWPFWGGMAFSLWNMSFISWLILQGPGTSLSKPVGAAVLVVSFALVGYAFVLFTRIRTVIIHKVMAYTTLALMSVAMIGVMLFSDHWSLEKAIGQDDRASSVSFNRAAAESNQHL